MTAAPEVQFVLNAVDSNWPGPESDLSDVPLERVDRDNADNLDGTWTHTTDSDLEELAIVSAATVSRTDEPMGTAYDLKTDRVVGVRVEAAHVSEYGCIDPQIGTEDERTGLGYPTTTWDGLVENVRRAILTSRTFPSVSNRSNVGFKDLFVENYADTSSNYADWYRVDWDVRFSGFEDLP